MERSARGVSRAGRGNVAGDQRPHRSAALEFGGVVRADQGYNTRADADRLMTALAVLLPQAQRGTL